MSIRKLTMTVYCNADDAPFVAEEMETMFADSGSALWRPQEMIQSAPADDNDPELTDDARAFLANTEA